jgi:hypothetical protein
VFPLNGTALAEKQEFSRKAAKVRKEKKRANVKSYEFTSNFLT